MGIRIILLKRKSKLPRGNSQGYFKAKKALFGLATNEFTTKIGNLCNDSLGINGARGILGHGYYEWHTQKRGDNSKP